jgi:hypothetical protein
MDSELTELFRQERERVFTPTAGFCERVMFRLQKESEQQQTFWETVLAASCPPLGATVVCLLVLMGVRMMLPVTPSRGLSEIYAESEVPPGLQAIYMDVDTPSTTVVFEQLISGDEQ